MFRRSQEEERISERNKNEGKKGQQVHGHNIFYYNFLLDIAHHDLD